jgi:anti-sigma factor RsiW
MLDRLHAYVDGELDLVHTLQVEQHLQNCPTCAAACAALRELHASLGAGLPRFEPPADLHKRVCAKLRQIDRSSTQHSSSTRHWRWMSAAACLALLSLAVLGGLRLRWAPAEQDRVSREVIDSHIRAQMAEHLVDVESSDQHTVKPWFRGKLDFSPAVRDLADQGFILVGGRLDYVNGRPVAAVVYRRRQHVVNLLIWPARENEERPRSETRQGYHLIHWRRDGMSWWAISDLNAAELAEFARLQGNE